MLNSLRLSAGERKSEVDKAFKIQRVPHYIIIERDGRIFDAEASMPDEDKMPARIEEMLSAK
ncbi:hypothetical protein ACE38W_17770 [Chitinophaga sp. Hz27]|uniref:hypothetical protein n=1 Tax=Chitinophaga sp. Hz27 TaxID=3347169 RepID=UPI0035DF82FD